MTVSTTDLNENTSALPADDQTLLRDTVEPYMAELGLL